MDEQDVTVSTPSDSRPSESRSGSIWQDLPYRNPYPNYIGPGDAIKALSLLALSPVVVAALYGVLPRVAQHQMGNVTEFVVLVSTVGAALFLLCLFLYRMARQWRQLRLNASLAEEPPKDYVLYLRSFRRTGAVVVPNHLPGLADRRLLGNFWDVELALSMSLSEKLPVLALGPKWTSLGAAKLVTNDESWKGLVEQLAYGSKVIFVVPDDREGTLWELRRILIDSVLRRKTIVMMPPEQHGWRRRIRRLPTVAHSWTRIRQALEPEGSLPPYSPEGAFLLTDESGSQFTQMGLAHFDPTQVRNVVAIAIAGSSLGSLRASDGTTISTFEEDWRASIDPVWPVVVVSVLVAGNVLAEMTTGASPGFALTLLALFAGAFGSWLANSCAFTLTREESSVRRRGQRESAFARLRFRLFGGEWVYASTWFGLRRAPGTVRNSVNALVLLGLLFVLRSFIAEPFKIPSSSMRPTLEVGDFILVNKFIYGIRLPIIEKKILTLSDPRPGDLVVFRYPVNPSQDFIKRVVGLPGDEVVYRDKKITVNGVPWPQTPGGTYGYLEGLSQFTAERFIERSDGRDHAIAVNPAMQPVYPHNVRQFPGRENCVYDERGFTCKVPAGNYLMMGDNRDNSDDSRYWGFVPDDHLRGKVFFIWFNWNDIESWAFERVGTSVR